MSFTIDLLKTHQDRLKSLGYYSGIIDGIEGVLTSLAVSKFKAAHGMLERDYPGPKTMAALWSDAAKPRMGAAADGDDPAWIMEARRLIGTDEAPGSLDNQVIMKWAKDLDQWYPSDATAWCGLFVAHCMAFGAPDIPQGFNRLGAREWLKYGEECKAGYGVIGVFWRGSVSGWQGHVGFIVGEDASTWHVLGGNQSDSVNVTRLSKSRALGFRCPPGYVPARDLKSVTTGDMSVNEA